MGHPVSSAVGNAVTSKGEWREDETRPLKPTDSKSSESSYTLFLMLLPSVSSAKGSQEFPTATNSLGALNATSGSEPAQDILLCVQGAT